MIKKIDRLRAAMTAGDWQQAVSIAAKFPRLGDAKEAVTRAQTAFTYPEFLRQIGKDPDACINEGIEALMARYSS